jgi:ABC-2 type transport system ATP-binding protein
MNTITLRNVAKRYRRAHLGRVKETLGVSDLSLEIRAGEVFGLIGLNGSGKTTTIKLILGLHIPNAGAVEVLGKPMPNLEVLRKIGYLPEGAYISRYLSGREAVMLFASLSNIPPSRRPSAVDEVLEKVGMTRAGSRRISEYSKGMLQRVSIAQALVHDPEILILDEPITGLDPLAVREVRAMILWLKSRGKTVFFSSHDISEVEKVCDRIGILAGGRLARLVEPSEWRGREGRLEEIFSSTVTRSEDIGPIRWQS